MVSGQGNGEGWGCMSEQSGTPLVARVCGARRMLRWRRNWRHAALCCGKACAATSSTRWALRGGAASHSRALREYRWQVALEMCSYQRV